MAHRGPDDEGYIAIYVKEGDVVSLGGADSQIPLSNILELGVGANLYFAHRRLSIIDLSSAGHQPMSSSCGKYWVTYNGELYNHKLLREELKGRGYSFQTRTDTEVLLAAYKEWGEDCLDHFDGMWAFVLYDKDKNILFGSRDRFGVKPFYYVKTGSFFAFASEAKAFSVFSQSKKEVSPDAVFDYLAFGIDRWNNGNTFVANLFELPPSHAFRVSLSERQVQFWRYYKLPRDKGLEWEVFSEKKAREHVNQVRELLFASVRRHLSSDVAVGTCLSGGIDSSSLFVVINSLLQKEEISELGIRPKAFTVCYDDSVYDERQWASLVVQQTGAEWHTVYPKGEEMIADLEDLIYTQDFPFVSTSIYAQYRLMKLAKSKGVKVLLDGQGGDELFTGYAPYYTAFFREMLRGLAWSDFIREWGSLQNASLGKIGIVKKALLDLLKKNIPTFLKKWVYQRSAHGISLLTPGFIDEYFPSSLERIMASYDDDMFLSTMLFSLMTSRSLPNLLRYEDRNSMRFQIESRTPFADDRALIEAVFAFPQVYKIHEGFSKWLLREAVRLELPKEIYFRSDKIGFSTPEAQWLRGFPDFSRSQANLLRNVAEFVNVDAFEKKFQTLKQNPKKNCCSQTLWRIINLAYWANM